jgi:NAD(P)-dependent dehydrogenase (short-subunit alcohol dehydrogenase family)
MKTQALMDKHALVTGAGSGIGLACAGALLDLGARVTLTGRDGARLARARMQLEEAGHAGRVAICVLDVAVEASVQAASRRRGRISAASIY